MYIPRVTWIITMFYIETLSLISLTSLVLYDLVILKRMLNLLISHEVSINLLG